MSTAEPGNAEDDARGVTGVEEGADPAAAPGADRETMVIGVLPSWGRPFLDDMVDTLLDGASPFPCTFAVAAARKRTLRFAFVEDLDDPAAWTPLDGVLRHYLADYEHLSKDTSLIVIFRPEDCERTIEDYNATFWSVLQYLHEIDAQPWPADVPEDPDDPWWEFSFGGTSIFVVCNTPAHKERASRHSPTFTITFQPRWVFDGIGPETRQGKAARKVIRRRLSAYDAVEASPDLGDYGSPDNREWRQYFLPDDGNEPPLRCPFHTSARPGTEPRDLGGAPDPGTRGDP